MRLLRIFIFCLLVGQPLAAAISIEDVIGSTDKKEDKSEKVLPPDPMSLDPNWWQYYDTNDLAAKIIDSEAYYQKIADQAAEADKEEIQEYVQRILLNLKALPNAKAQVIPVFTPKPLKDEYTFDEVLMIASNKKNLESQLKDEKKEIALMQERSKKVLQHIDTLYVAYMGMREQNIAKQKEGLEIISLRMALAMTDESIRLSRQRIEQLQAEISQLDLELGSGFSKLAVSQVDEQGLNRDIEKARNDLKRAQAAALISEMNALGASGDTPLDRSRSYLYSQKAVLDRAKEALAKSDLIFYQAKENLVLMASDESVENEELSEDLAEWQEQLSIIKGSLSEWDAKTMQEYERSLKPLEADSSKLLEAIQQQRVQTVQETLKYINQVKLKLMFDDLMINDLKDRLTKREGTMALWFYYAWDWFESCCNPIVAWLYAPLIKVGGVPITVMSLLRIVVIIGLTFIFSSLIRRLLKRMNNSQFRMTDSSFFIIDKIIHYLILCFGFALTLASVGLSLSNLAIVLGALSVGIGFGLQTIVNNFLSSLIIMFSRTMKVGDMVELSDGKCGLVTAINIQNSIIHTGDGVDIILPNSQILSNRLTNWTLNDNFRRLHIPFSVAYGTDKETVVQAATEAAGKVPCTVKNSSYLSDPQVWLIGFGDSALNFELVVWVNVYGYGHKGSMNASYLWELENCLKKYGIEVPFPQREVRVIAQSASHADVAAASAFAGAN